MEARKREKSSIFQKTFTRSLLIIEIQILEMCAQIYYTRRHQMGVETRFGSFSD